MADDVRSQRRLHEILETGIGPEGADLLMDRLPQRPASDFATRDDVHANAIALRGEMTELRGGLQGEMAELRAELRGEMTELRGEMADLRTELRSDMAELRGDVRCDLATFKVELQRFFLATNVATMITLVGLVLGVNSL